MAPRLGRLGVGAKVSCLSWFIHPSHEIREKYPNPVSGHRLEGCTTIRQEVKKVSRRDQLCVIVHHDDFKTADGDYIELHAVKRYWKVFEEGDTDLLFDDPGDNVESEETLLVPLPEAVDEALNGQSVENNTIEALRDIVDIDDDNEPAPENVPQPTDNTTRIVSTEWGHSGLCFRRVNNLGPHRARLNFPVDGSRGDYYLQLFEGLFPRDLVLLVIEKVNANVEGGTVSYGEFLRWIGIWILMSTVDGADRRSFWSTNKLDPFHGAPFRVTSYMSRRRFDSILTNLGYTKEDPPSYRDRFWEVRPMLEMWNTNMANNFSPSWINCIDESMSKWVNEYTCPGFMFVPRKPWPFGNEYHDAGCAHSDIIWALDLREGKDRPTNLGNKEFDDLGKTTGILLRLTKSVWSSGKVFVLDSGFCVLQAIVELKKKGVFAAALIKKRRYWPKHVPGDEIIQHFAEKEVGDVDALKGELDGVPFYIHAMKEPDYTMMLMSTYGTLTRMGETKRRHYTEDRVKKVKEFKYPEVIYNHYSYRDMIDNHNLYRIHPISMEETWMTMRWPNRVFCFVLAVAVVNIQNAACYFLNKEKLDALNSRRQIAKALIFNRHLDEQNDGRRLRKRGSTDHALVMVLQFKKFIQGRLVTCKTKYGKWKCTNCSKFVRNYCSCTPGLMFCIDCFGDHRADVAMADSRHAQFGVLPS